MDLPETLVVDANILFSFFKEGSGRRRIVQDVRRHGCRLVSPAYVLEELAREQDRVREFATISETEFVFILSLLELAVETVDRDRYEEELPQASDLAPHDKDVPYFALALHRDAAIWSDETAFDEQDDIAVYSTEDLYGSID